MNSKLLLALCLAAASSTDIAHADVVTDRVLLVTGATGCTGNQRSFVRLHQKPDGTQTQEPTEWVVPTGKYLEITSIEYTTPYSTQWATGYLQSVDVSMRPRTASYGTSVFSAKYGNRQIDEQQADYSFDGTNQFVAHGAHTQVATFPVGPLMGSTARLCVAASPNYWLYSGSVRIRGRLIPTGAIIVGPPGGGVSTQD